MESFILYVPRLSAVLPTSGMSFQIQWLIYTLSRGPSSGLRSPRGDLKLTMISAERVTPSKFGLLVSPFFSPCYEDQTSTSRSSQRTTNKVRILARDVGFPAFRIGPTATTAGLISYRPMICSWCVTHASMISGSDLTREESCGLNAVSSCSAGKGLRSRTSAIVSIPLAASAKQSVPRLHRATLLIGQGL